MNANLFANFLTVGCIPVLILLLLIFYSKDQFNNIRNKMYKAQIWLTFIYVVTEVLFVLIVNYVGSQSTALILGNIVWRSHWVSAVLFWLMYEYYLIALLNKIDVDSFKDLILYNKLTKGIGISYVVIILFVAIFPSFSTTFDVVTPAVLNPNVIEFFPLKAVFIPSLFLMISDIIIGFILFKNINSKDKDIPKYKSIIIYTLGTMILFCFLQGFIEYVSFSPIAFTFLLYMLYYLNENPDIAILEEITNSKDDIEKSSQTKSDFLSNMSFEIKTPINIIISVLEDLNNTTYYNEEEAKKSIKQIVDNGNNLLDIVNNILDISKIETGKSTLSESDYNVKEILSNVIDGAKQKLGNKQVKFLINIDKSVSSVLHGDSGKLVQCLNNIVNNSIRFTEVGRITFTLSSSKQNGAEHLLFKISDTGIGIKDEDKNKLFTKGKKIDSSNTEDSAGLGLVVTKQYIEAMNGKIWLESQYRVGSTFYIEIVQKIIDATPLGDFSEVTTKASDEEKLDCSKFKVLIVDDNLLNIKVAKRLLENYKFTVDSVTSGKECIDKIKQEEKYDGIFMDHMMPEMDGIETLHVLKRLDGYQLPPIIALTANAIAGMKEMYLNEGFDDYLAKPINTHELDRVVNKFYRK